MANKIPASAEEMSNTAKTGPIPVDVFGVKELGIQAWQDGFYWPVHPELYSEICWELVRHYLVVSANAPADHRFVLLASLKAHLNLYQWVNLLLLQRKAGESGRELLLTGDTQYTRLLDGSSYIGSSRVEGKPLVRPAARHVLRACLSFCKGSALTLLKKAGRERLKKAGRERVLLMFMGQIRLGREYCAERGLEPIKIPLEFLLGSPIEDRSASWRDTVASLVDGYLQIIGRHCGRLSEEQCTIIVTYLDDAISEYRASFLGATRRLGRIPRIETMRLLSSSLGSPLHKVVGQAFRSLGGRLIGVTHSNAFCRPNTFAVCLNEMATCDEYVVGSKAEKKVFEFCIDHYKQRIPETPEISKSTVTTVRGHYRYQGYRAIRKLESIMVIGAPYVPTQHIQIPGAYGIRWLALELDVVERLKRAGFKVLYKAHPDRMEECRGIFECRVDSMIGGRSEDVWDLADCILNTTWGATSFGKALLTGKPSIVLDALGAPWEPAVRAVIEKRCLIVGTEFRDEDNSIRLVEADITRCIERLKQPASIAQDLAASEADFRELLR